MRTIHFSHLVLLGALLFAPFAAACASTPAAMTPPAVPVPTGVAEQQASPPRERLELKVRADFFAGMAGDDAAFARAMKVCDDALAANGDDAEALVWRGAGHLFESGMAYRKGDMATGGTLWGQGLGEMDRAVALDPDNLGVRIPRGAALLGAAPHIPDAAVARTLYERAASDYQVALRVQEPYTAKLSTHAREELFFGLADANAQLGNDPKARSYFERLVRDVPDSQLLPYARAWLSGKKPDPRPGCTGCHSG